MDWVRLSISAARGKDWAERLRQHLSAELARHEIAACSDIPGSHKAPLAIVRVVESETHKVGIEVRVEDQVTDKTLSRELDLSHMPDDSHAMTVALGVSELLRASWAELNLNRFRTTAKSVPTSVRHALSEDARPTPTALGVEIVGEEFAGGLRQGGANVLFEAVIADPFELGLRLGGRESLTVTAADGAIRASSWLLGISPRLRLTAAEAAAGLSIAAHLDAARIQFSATPISGATSMSGSGTALMAGLSLRASLKLSQDAELILEVTGGDVTKSVRARDHDREVVAMSGAWAGAGLGVKVFF